MGPTHHVVVPARATNAEAFVATALSLLSRTLVRFFTLQQTLDLLDRVPGARSESTEPIRMPPESAFRGAGACLARCVARSEYLRRSGGNCEIVIGTKGIDSTFEAHSWLAPFDDDVEHHELHRISR